MLFKRLTGRRICQDCGRVFNVFTSPPGTPPHCAQCNDMPRLLQRPDDREEVIGKRLEVYEAQTKPLIEYYRTLVCCGSWTADADTQTVFEGCGARRCGARLTTRHRSYSAASSRSPISSRRQPRGVRVAPAHGERLQFAARRQHLGADAELGGPRIDDGGQPFGRRFLFRRRARDPWPGSLSVTLAAATLPARRDQ